MKVRKWTHPDLDQPIYLKLDECAPVEYLKQTSHRGLFESSVIEITNEEFEAQDLSLLLDPEDFDDDNEKLDKEVEEAFQSENAPQLPKDREIVGKAPKAVVIRPISLSRKVGQELIDSGIDYGSTIATEQLEQALGCTRDLTRFQFAVCVIRSIFLENGMYLTARGQNGEQYVVLAANQNIDVMRAFTARAAGSLKNAVILGSKTDKSSMTTEEKRRHDAQLAKAAHRQALMRNSETVMEQLEATKEGRKLLTK